MRYIGVPGCWAERYGSRAPEWRTEVSNKYYYENTRATNRRT